MEGGIFFRGGLLGWGVVLSVSMPVRMMALKVAKVLPPSGLPVLSGVRLRVFRQRDFFPIAREAVHRGPRTRSRTKARHCVILRLAK